MKEYLSANIEPAFESIDDERQFRSQFYMGKKRRRICTWPEELLDDESEKAGDENNTEENPTKREAGGYISSDLGDINLSEFKLPTPKIFTGTGASDRNTTLLKFLKEIDEG